MTTIDAEVTINETGEVSVQVPVTPNVPSGHYRAVLVLETQDREPNPSLAESNQREPAANTVKPFTFKVLEYPAYPPDFTYSREDVYDDDDKPKTKEGCAV